MISGGHVAVLAAVLLFMLWHPALSVATLKPQQNIVAVVVDDSTSMSVADEGGSPLPVPTMQCGQIGAYLDANWPPCPPGTNNQSGVNCMMPN